MEQTFRICRVHGIEIGANWSLLVIAWLITWGLAAGVLPEAVPGASTVAYWSTAILAAALFFASLVAHELSHAVVARRHGVEVSQITLWMFGGVAKMADDDPDPSTELRVGAIGPLTSLGAAAVAALVAAGLGLVGPFELVSASLWWLAWINALLAVFNMLPAFPLDGGRVLRALLWRRWGDKVRATQTAGATGEAFGYGLVALGLLASLGGAFVSGLWFVFLGWFLLSAARAEAAVVTRHELLDGVLAADVMTPNPVVVGPELTIAELVEDHILRDRHTAYPVVAPTGQVLGLVTLEHVRRVPAAERTRRTVAEVGHRLSQIPRCQVDRPVVELIGELATSRVGRALVFDGSDLVGIISRTDLVQALHLRTELGVRAPAPAGA